MKDNERIYVKGYDCESVEDNYENGESLSPDSSWTSGDTGFKNDAEGYATVLDALEAVCRNENFDFVRENWTSRGTECGEEYGLFNGNVLVDDDNSQASPSEIEKWKKGEKRLWSCYLHVRLEVRTVRELAPADVAGSV